MIKRGDETRHSRQRPWKATDRKRWRGMNEKYIKTVTQRKRRDKQDRKRKKHTKTHKKREKERKS